MLRTVAIILGVLVIAITGYAFFFKDRPQSAVYVRPMIPVTAPVGSVGTPEYTDEHDAYVSYDPVTHVYEDAALGFTMSIPIGFMRVGEYDVFRTGDEDGGKGYADTAGMAVTVETFPKPTKQLPYEWFIQDDQRTLSLKESINGRVKGRQSFNYKAEWEGLGQSIGVVIDGDDYVIKLDCFHPPTENYSYLPCSDAINAITESLVFR